MRFSGTAACSVGRNAFKVSVEFHTNYKLCNQSHIDHFVSVSCEFEFLYFDCRFHD